MKKTVLVMLTVLTLLFAPMSSQACEVTTGCLGITARITKGIIRIIRDIYHFRHNDVNNDQNTQGNIINNVIDNMNHHQNNHRNNTTRTSGRR